MELDLITQCFVPMELVAKGRPKASVRAGKVFMRTPGKTRDAEEQARAFFAYLTDLRPTAKEVPLMLQVVCFRTRPASAKKTVILPVSRPDVDNYLKLVMDALNGTAWVDDSSIVGMEGWKVFSPIVQEGYGIRLFKILEAPAFHPEDFGWKA